MTRLISRITFATILFVGPFTFLHSLYVAGLNVVHSPLEFAEEYVAHPVIAAESLVDSALGKPDQLAQMKRAAKKAAKKAAKAQAKAAQKK